MGIGIMENYEREAIAVAGGDIHTITGWVGMKHRRPEDVNFFRHMLESYTRMKRLQRARHPWAKGWTIRKHSEKFADRYRKSPTV